MINFFTVLNVCAQIAGVVGVIYGFFWLKNFKKQKRIEHLCDNAKGALAVLRESEGEIREISLAKHRQLGEQKGSISDHYKLQLKTLSALGALRDYLLLLDWDADLVHAKDIEVVNAWLARLNKILGHKYNNEQKDFFIILEGLDNPETNEFEKMRKVLRHIYMLKIKA